MAAPAAKKAKTRAFQSTWTREFGFVFLKDRAVCTLCCENVVCRTSSVKRHFETKHEKTFKDQADKAESIKRAVSRYDKQASSLKDFTTVKHHGFITVPEKFSCLRDIALALLSVFGSTYLCEQVFSHMRHVLSPTRSRLTTDHSEACLLLKVTNYEPQITELSQAKQSQGSH